jgi:hypothetical protein
VFDTLRPAPVHYWPHSLLPPIVRDSRGLEAGPLCPWPYQDPAGALDDGASRLLLEVGQLWPSRGDPCVNIVEEPDPALDQVRHGTGKVRPAGDLIYPLPADATQTDSDLVCTHQPRQPHSHAHDYSRTPSRRARTANASLVSRPPEPRGVRTHLAEDLAGVRIQVVESPVRDQSMWSTALPAMRRPSSASIAPIPFRQESSSTTWLSRRPSATSVHSRRRSNTPLTLRAISSCMSSV